MLVALSSVATPPAVEAATLSDLTFIHAFIASFSMIVVSELGDKTFFIAAIMAMRHPRLTVFGGAISALAFMTVLSALFGYVTTIIPRVYTYYISTVLFAIFGFKMLYDGMQMSKDEGAEELEEVQAALRRQEEDDSVPLSSDMESGITLAPKIPSKARRFLFACFSRIFIQAFSMTFLAEWGDRSQLATVVLAASEDISGVCIGGILGHSLCTGLAVLGGKMIAQKISVRTVTIIGGVVFLLFALASLVMNPNA